MDKMIGFRDKYLAALTESALVIYDLGSRAVSGGSYRPVFEHSPWIYKGIDLEPGENVDVILSRPYAWKELPAESADVLVSGQALEHIEYFWLTMLEVWRVLKPGGLCCIIAPSGGPEHRYPVDCWRFFPDGLEALSRYAGFETEQIYKQQGSTGHSDGSDLWQDSFLVCRKPFLPRFRRLKERFRRILLRELTLRNKC